MINDKTLVKVTNRSRGSLSYAIPDMGNLSRRFSSGESKNLTAEEIRKLDWTPGGHVLLKDFLQIDNKELVEEILHEVEPEYYLTKEQVEDLLLNGSMDEFMDALDFAPEGVINLMKEKAIALEIPDTRKREALSKRTNSNIDNAIRINQISKADEGDQEEVKKERRVQHAAAAQSGDQPKERRTKGPQHYNVVKK